MEKYKRNVTAFSISIMIAFSTFFVILVLPDAYGVKVYMKDDVPFGSPLDVLISKWWTWWVAVPGIEGPEGIVPRDLKEDGCLMNKLGQMVMLMDPTVKGEQRQICEISSNQGIIVPLWTAFMEDSTPEFHGYSYEELSKAARVLGDLGAVTSQVKLDDKPIAKLVVESKLKGALLPKVSDSEVEYTVTSMENVTEVYSKGFNITIPEDTHMADQNIGTWRSGAHGWYVFLEPLSPGNHTLFYSTNVKGGDPIAAQITYILKVK